MDDVREIRELLVMLHKSIMDNNYIQDKQMNMSFSGMCDESILMCHYHDIINEDEFNVLDGFIDEYGYQNNLNGYWWKFGYKRPRLLWITKQIKILDDVKSG